MVTLGVSAIGAVLPSGAMRAEQLSAAQLYQRILTETARRGLSLDHPRIAEITHHLTQVMAGQVTGSSDTLERLGTELARINWEELRHGEGYVSGGQSDTTRAELAAARVRENVLAHQAVAAAQAREHTAAVRTVQERSAALARRHNDAGLRRLDGTPILPPGYEGDQGSRVIVAANRTREAQAAYDQALLSGNPATIAKAETRLAATRADEFTVAAEPGARILGGLNTLPDLTPDQVKLKTEALAVVGAATAGHRATWDRAFENLSRLNGNQALIDCSPDRWASEFGHVDSIMRGVVAGRGGSPELTPGDYALAYDSLARTQGADYAARHLILRAKQEGKPVDQLLSEFSAAGTIPNIQAISAQVKKLQGEMGSCGPEATDNALQLLGKPEASLLERLQGASPVKAELVTPEAAARAVVIAAQNPEALKQNVVKAAEAAEPDAAEGHGLKKVAEKVPDKGTSAVARV